MHSMMSEGGGRLVTSLTPQPYFALSTSASCTGDEEACAPLQSCPLVTHENHQVSVAAC